MSSARPIQGQEKPQHTAYRCCKRSILKDRHVQALVMCPTRELAIQVSEELAKLAKYLHGVMIAPILAASPSSVDWAALGKRFQVVIGTPGRILDHLHRRSIDLSTVRVIVLDEADEMLDMGFRDDIGDILNRIPEKRQTVLFSATMPAPIMELARRLQKKSSWSKSSTNGWTVPTVEQIVYTEVTGKAIRSKHYAGLSTGITETVARLLQHEKRRVDEVTGRVIARGYSAEGLHGDMTQGQRERVMAEYRSGAIDLAYCDRCRGTGNRYRRYRSGI